MKNILIILSMIWILSGCGGSSPAGDTNSVGISLAVAIENIDLNGANVLALIETESGASNSPSSNSPSFNGISTQSISERCDELGRLDGVIYSGLEIINRGGANITPCFSNVHYLTGDSIYGQYRPDVDGFYVSFITDSNGKVHHLQKHPRKTTGFKSDKLIRQYKGKPLYLNSDSFLTSLNLVTGEEEEIINNPVGHFVILNKNNGENIIYHDLGGGHVIRPNGGIEDIPEINSSRFYYKNGSEDLGYVSTMKFRNMIFNADGSINDNTGIPAMYSAIPVAYEAFITDASGSLPNPINTAPVIGTSMVTCERSENLLICDGNYLKAYVIARSDEDIEEINWCDYEHCNQSKTLMCVNNNYIYFYSSNIVDSWRLTQINRDLSSFEHIITNIDIDKLTCLSDGKLLISGQNIDTAVNENFHFDPVSKIKTMITEPISDFIN